MRNLPMSVNQNTMQNVPISLNQNIANNNIGKYMILNNAVAFIYFVLIKYYLHIRFFFIGK